MTHAPDPMKWGPEYNPEPPKVNPDDEVIEEARQGIDTHIALEQLRRDHHWIVDYGECPSCADGYCGGHGRSAFCDCGNDSPCPELTALDYIEKLQDQNLEYAARLAVGELYDSQGQQTWWVHHNKQNPSDQKHLKRRIVAAWDGAYI